MRGRGEFFIPADKADFAALLKGIALRKSIHEAKELGPGSETTNERAYFPRRLSREDFLENLKLLGLKGDSSNGKKDHWKEAGNLLHDWKAFQNFLDATRPNVNVDNLQRDGDHWPGQFTTILRFLEDLLESGTDMPTSSQPDEQDSQSLPQTGTIPRSQRTTRHSRLNYFEDWSDSEGQADGEEQFNEAAFLPKRRKLNEPAPQNNDMASDESKFPPVPDESIINTLFIALLKELGSIVPKCRSKWVLDHIDLKASSRKASYVARTDGCLLTKNKRTVQAIVEVKPRIRAAVHLKQVQSARGSQS